MQEHPEGMADTQTVGSEARRGEVRREERERDYRAEPFGAQIQRIGAQIQRIVLIRKHAPLPRTEEERRARVTAVRT